MTKNCSKCCLSSLCLSDGKLRAFASLFWRTLLKERLTMLATPRTVFLRGAGTGEAAREDIEFAYQIAGKKIGCKEPAMFVNKGNSIHDSATYTVNFEEW